MKISIVIPCYNEFDTISLIIEKIIKTVSYDYEIIVIDDCSTDGTRELLEYQLKNKVTNLLFNDKNFGKGYCLKRGILNATGDIIIVQDADLEYDPSEFPKLIEPIRKGFADVVYGSRFSGSEEKAVLFFWHRVGNFLLTTFSNMLTNLNLTDMEVCYKAFKSEILKKIDLKEKRFGFEPEVTAKISKMNLKIYEVGIKYYGRSYNEGKKINWKDGFSAIRCIIYYNLFSK